MKTTDEFKKLVEDMLEAVKEEIPIEITYWNGETKKFGTAEPVAKITIKTEKVFKDMMGQLSLGFGENYIEGNIEIEGDMLQILRMETMPHLKKIKPSLRVLKDIAINRLFTLNSIKQSKDNIEAHYDLGNDFYKLFLDESFTYSCGYFKDWDNNTLEDAQNNKYELILRKLNIKNRDKIVDIGCGWGGFLIYAAQKSDIKGIGCTISKNQYEYAKEKIKDLHLDNRIEVVYEDYRNLSGTFDKFISIGAYEHIGKNYAFMFFEKVRKILREGGTGLLHTIGHNEPMQTDPFTTKYVFPGGYLPSLEELVRRLRHSGFYTIDVENLRPHYAKTIENWIERFQSNIDRVKEMFDEKFIRLWWLYLNGAEEGFKYGDCQLYQIVFSKGQIDIPKYRGDIYKDW